MNQAGTYTELGQAVITQARRAGRYAVHCFRRVWGFIRWHLYIKYQARGAIELYESRRLHAAGKRRFT